ncbi:hypothetical protein [Anatilimnocola floriformis]|uniref:hypothetical protein n=1 Tax=Anatilimnocola floriformis TaxID=2948575 RepID=UPI0020C1C488|nr:hypothetical protein [Anatilimnocola floriformis]
MPALLVLCICSDVDIAQLAAQEKQKPPATPTQPTTQPAKTTQPVAIRPDHDQPESPPDGQLPPEAHPWGRFPVGSWKTVRVTSETLDPQGRIVTTSLTETKTTLVAADDHEYQLRVESTVEVAGRRFANPPQVTRHSYWGDLAATPNSGTGLRKMSSSELELNGRHVACEIRQAISERDGQRRQTVVHYTTTQFPYLLKRESSITPLEGSTQPATSTTVEVIAANLPFRVAGMLKPVAYVRTNYQGTKSSSVTVEIQSADVPGGVVNHSAQERDAAGTAVTRRSSLELVDYGLGSESPDDASPGRRRWMRKQNRRDR